jgi:ABC-type antimicrobial peptide transport system permease subunit
VRAQGIKQIPIDGSGRHRVQCLKTLVLGLLAVGEILMLSYLERRPHLDMLRALGWAPSTITRFLGVQALGLGMVGGSAAAVLTFALGLVLGAPVSAQILGCFVALAVGRSCSCARRDRPHDSCLPWHAGCGASRRPDLPGLSFGWMVTLFEDRAEVSTTGNLSAV